MFKRSSAVIAAAFLMVASSADAARYTWTQTATEDQVNNAPTKDGSTDSGATGPSTITYDSFSDELSYDIEWINLENDLSAIHVHGPSDAPESTSSILFSVFFGEQDVVDAAVDRRNDSVVDTTTLSEAAVISDLDADGVLDAMLAEDGYVNIHSTFWPMGEIRGNLTLVESLLEQTKDQQRCTNTMFKGADSYSKLVAKILVKCIGLKTKGKLEGGTVAACVAAASSATDKTVSKIGTDFDDRCAGEALPSFGLETPEADDAILAAVPDATNGPYAAVFDPGFNIDNGVDDGSNPGTAACQGAVSKTMSKCQAAINKEFSKCLKSGLKGKDALFEDAEEVTSCIGADPKGKIAKACDAVDGKIRSTIGKKCSDLNLASVFAGCNESTEADTAQCMRDRLECGACLAETIIGDLTGEFDCDVYDDGLANSSCVISPG